MENTLRATLLPLYEQMLNKITSSRDLYSFCMQWGKDFPSHANQGVLFVGKATNGWITSSKDISVLFGNTNDRVFCRKDQMTWVHNLDGKRGDDPKGYNTRKSAFWRVVKKTSQSVYGNEDWYSKVAWSNLYKVSFSKGNPDAKLKREQTRLCQSILREEINILSPKYVVFLTSGWEREFIKDLIRDFKVIKTESVRWGKGFVTQAYVSEKVVFITTPHPQGKNEADHVKAITKLLNSNQLSTVF